MKSPDAWDGGRVTSPVMFLSQSGDSFLGFLFSFWVLKAIYYRESPLQIPNINMRWSHPLNSSVVVSGS